MQYPPMETLVQKIEAVMNGESEETLEEIRIEKGDWLFREAMEWVILTREAKE